MPILIFHIGKYSVKASSVRKMNQNLVACISNPPREKSRTTNLLLKIHILIIPQIRRAHEYSEIPKNALLRYYRILAVHYERIFH